LPDNWTSPAEFNARREYHEKEQSIRKLNLKKMSLLSDKEKILKELLLIW